MEFNFRRCEYVWPHRQVLPFIALGLGVNDLFIIVHACRLLQIVAPPTINYVKHFMHF